MYVLRYSVGFALGRVIISQPLPEVGTYYTPTVADGRVLANPTSEQRHLPPLDSPPVPTSCWTCTTWLVRESRGPGQSHHMALRPRAACKPPETLTALSKCRRKRLTEVASVLWGDEAHSIARGRLWGYASWIRFRPRLDRR